MFISILYECVLWLLALISLPKFLYGLLIQKKYRKNVLQRLGIDFPKIDKNTRPLIWIHAVSVGETKAVSALAKKLKQLPTNPILMISSITETGNEEAKRSIPYADYHVFMPFDFYFLVRHILANVKPDMIIIAETDFWYNFLRVAKQQGSHIALVNGKLSERSTERFKQFSFFTKPLFSLVDIFCVQSELYKQRFSTIGIDEAKIAITGNLKFDAPPKALSESEKEAFKSRLGIEKSDFVIVIGSTHEPEEKLLLAELQNLWNVIPHLKVIIVPRHPERFDAVEAILSGYPISYRRYLNCDKGDNKASITLLDTMGQLGNCYQVASVAIVAGSYTDKVGGHNILEPLWFGVPTIFGPHMHGQPDLVEAVMSHEAAKLVPIDELSSVILSLYENSAEQRKLQLAAKKLIATMQGATERTYDNLKRI